MLKLVKQQIYHSNVLLVKGKLQMDHSELNHKLIYRIGAIAAILQLAAILGYSIALAILGPKPVTASDYFTIQQTSKAAVFLRGDFLLMVLIGLYIFTFPALYLALRKVNSTLATFALIFTFISALITFSTESTFSMVNLGEQYAAATDETQRSLLLAAGEAVIASDMWNGSGAYVSGWMLQGAGVIISLVMLGSKEFGKITAYSGLISNGFDLIQHALHPFLPFLSDIFIPLAGPFYLIWYPMLFLDLRKLSKGTKN